MCKSKLVCLLAITTMLLFGCKKDKSDTIEEKPLTFSFEKNSYYPYELAQANTTGLNLNEKKYIATLSDTEVVILAYENSLVVVVPDFPEGAYTLAVDINGKKYEAKITLLKSPPIVNPDVVYDKYLKDFGESIIDFKTLSEKLSGSDKINFLSDVKMIENWQSNLQTQYESLSIEDKKIAAFTIAANSMWILEIRTAMKSLKNYPIDISQSELNIIDWEKNIDKRTNNYLKNLVETVNVNIPKVMSRVASFTSAGTVVSGEGLGQATAIGLGVALGELILAVEVTVEAQNELMETTFMPLDKIYADNKRKANLTYYDDEKIALKITNDYRTLYNLDVNSTVSIVKDANGIFSEVKEISEKVNEYLPDRKSVV